MCLSLPTCVYTFTKHPRVHFDIELEERKLTKKTDVMRNGMKSLTSWSNLDAELVAGNGGDGIGGFFCRKLLTAAAARCAGFGGKALLLGNGLSGGSTLTP